MGQGSQEEYRSQPDSWKLPRTRQAWRMASISAWAVGSLADVTRLAPSAMILPSLTIRAAKGPPWPEFTFSMARAMARCRNGSDMGESPLPSRVPRKRRIHNANEEERRGIVH